MTAARLDRLLPAAAHLLGEDLPGGAEAAAVLDLPPARKVCVVLLDGLGHANLQARAGDAPFLTSGPGRLTRIESTVPSTTAANITALGTGLPPGVTGMLGYTVRDPDNGRLLNLISWAGHADPAAWQREPTVFERLAGRGRVSVAIGPWQHEGSGLTVAALRGAEYDSAESLAERVDRALDALAEPDVDLVYVYWSEIDHLGHGLGWRSEQWRAELAATDTQLARLAAGLPADTLLLVTADHGMVDVPARESEVFGGPSRYDVATRADLADGVALVAGEPRMVHLHCHPGRAHDVARTWAYVLGDRAVVRGRAEAIADWFAPVAPRFEAVIGDVVVAMLGDIAVHDSRTQSEGSLGLVGMHGSITPEETGIPLLALRS